MKGGPQFHDNTVVTVTVTVTVTSNVSLSEYTHS